MTYFASLVDHFIRTGKGSYFVDGEVAGIAHDLFSSPSQCFSSL